MVVGDGNPQSVNNDELMRKVCDIFKEIRVDISPGNLEACHHLKIKDRTMFTFLNRRDCE